MNIVYIFHSILSESLSVLLFKCENGKVGPASFLYFLLEVLLQMATFFSDVWQNVLSFFQLTT